MSRQELIEYLAKQISEKKKSEQPLFACIEGIDTSGKSTLCVVLADYLTSQGYSVIKASIDDFHYPSEKRYRLGSKSPKGYYRETFDYDSLKKYLIEPLKSGVLEYRTASYDLKTESRLEQETKKATMDSILLLEGVFLHRPELINNWDISIFIHIDFEQVITRAKVRDLGIFGSEADVEDRYRSKYIPGQQIYLMEAKPHRQANIVIDNNDFNNPRVIRDDVEIEKLWRRLLDF